MLGSVEILEGMKGHRGMFSQRFKGSHGANANSAMNELPILVEHDQPFKLIMVIGPHEQTSIQQDCSPQVSREVLSSHAVSGVLVLCRRLDQVVLFIQSRPWSI